MGSRRRSIAMRTVPRLDGTAQRPSIARHWGRCVTLRHVLIAWLYVYAFALPFETIAVSDLFGTPQRLVAMVVGAGWLLRLISRRSIGALREMVGLMGFGVWAAASVLWAANPDKCVASLLTLLQLLLFTIALVDLLRAQDLSGILTAHALGGVIAALLALLLGRTNGMRLVLSPEAGPAHFAAGLVATAIVLLGFLATARSWTSRSVILAGTLVVILAIVGSGTRSALFAVVVGIAAVVWRYKRARVHGLVLLVFLSVSIAVYPGMLDRVLSHSVATGGAGRLDIWRVGLVIATENVFVGVGYGNFKDSFTEDVIARAGPYMYPQAVWPGRDAHNVYLQIFSELGIIGMTLGLLAVLPALRRAMRSQWSTAVIVSSIVLAYSVQGLALPLLHRKYFWFALGLCLSVSRHVRTRTVRSSD